MIGQPHLKAFLSSASEGVVLVRVIEAKGSTPRESGAFMLVSASGSFATIGGGRLEMEAIERARAILAGAQNADLALPLGPEIGQCCGGHVTVSFELFPPERFEGIEEAFETQQKAWPEVWLFGGGHVGRALVRHLSLLPVKAHLVENRAEELELTPDGAEKHLAALPESLVSDIAPGAAVIVLTHDHALDFLIVRAALERGDLALVGMIGSATKRAVFESQFRREGGDSALLSRLVCPIGEKTSDKRPEVIAVSVAAQIMATLA